MRRIHPLVSEQAENLVPEIIPESSAMIGTLRELLNNPIELENSSLAWRDRMRRGTDDTIEDIGPQTVELIPTGEELITAWGPAATVEPEIIPIPLDSNITHFFDVVEAERQGQIIEERDEDDSPELTTEQLIYLDQVVEETHQEIPLNSPTLLITETTSRFSSALWYEKIQEKKIILAGLGGIGSYVGFLLSRMQPESLTIYDDDKVEMVNLSGQFYGTSHIGKLKSSALASIMADFGNFRKYICFPQKFTADSATSDIMICGFDNMAARKTFFNKWIAHVMTLPKEEWGNCLFIDGRLSAEYLQIYCLKGNDVYFIDQYTKHQLFSDKEADGTVCSYKQTSFMANMIASLMVNLFVNFVANQCDPLIPRDVPYLTEYTGETMFFNTVQ